jgi:AraC-like DNA-binding protein
LAAVPPERLARLSAGAPDGCRWLSVTTWLDTVTAIRTRPVELAVVDPLLGGQPRSVEIERLRQHFPSLPLVVYTVLAPETAGVLLDLGRAGIRRVILYRFDDAPSALREVLQSELEQSASRRILTELTTALPGLPDPLAHALEAMLHAPGDNPTVAALADHAQLTRRTCERLFSRRGLPSPKTVMLLARVLYAHRLLLDPGYTVEDVAAKLGYGRVRTLQMHFREVFGLTAGEVRMSLSSEDAVRLIVRRYLDAPRQAAS